MKQVIIHLKESYLNSIKELGYDYTLNDNEVDVIVPDVEYSYEHYIQDPDAQLCVHYGIDYDYVNMMELAWLVLSFGYAFQFFCISYSKRLKHVN